MTVTTAERPSLLEAFQPPAEQLPDTSGLFDGDARLIVQTPPARNDYKKASGSSDGAKTYDTTAT
ncbi:hypothetical protein [Actinomadura opuntiae]|uniref:hypothetical protein n=1 Tax=Actinomadura sp. OS1-43 TaxID=604315 RepID=UPI00255B04A2|nr:hypothetical protein [Actinomadura sp. OS1-43]MDL4812774.1 hypothetical protein [Actinomadura sp. OS1-43]